MKKILYTFLFCLVMLSCSDSDNTPGIGDPDPDPVPGPTESLFNVTHSVNADKGNIFEMMMFELNFAKSTTMYDLQQVCDSIVWKVSGIEGSADIFSYYSEEGFHESHLTTGWSQAFFLPAKQEAYLIYYKDSKVVYGDTITFEIKDDRDFLGFKWKDITANSKGSTGYNDKLGKTNFATYYELENNVPSVTLFRWYDRSEEEEVFAQNSKSILYNYIVSLYSLEPIYKEGDDALQKKYEELFANNRADYTPLCIWQTPKARIVLVEHYDNYTYADYRIYAEPNVIE